MLFTICRTVALPSWHPAHNSGRWWRYHHPMALHMRKTQEVEVSCLESSSSQVSEADLKHRPSARRPCALTNTVYYQLLYNGCAWERGSQFFLWFSSAAPSLASGFPVAVAILMGDSHESVTAEEPDNRIPCTWKNFQEGWREQWVILGSPCRASPFNALGNGMCSCSLQNLQPCRPLVIRTCFPFSLLQEDSEEEDGDLCRICQIAGGSPTNPLLEPCGCVGSLRFVHQECLKKWLKVKITSGRQGRKQGNVPQLIINETPGVGCRALMTSPSAL